MDVLSQDKLALFLYFFVPGFISIKVFESLVPSERRDWGKSALEVVAFSCVNFGLFFWIPVWAKGAPAWQGYPATALFLFALPMLWGFLAYVAMTHRSMRGKVVSPIPTAWDDFFRRGESCFALVHLKGGMVIGGLFDQDAAVSSYPNAKDIYLREVWRVDDTGAFVEPIPLTKGVWIGEGSFDHIEFFELVNVEVTDGRQATED